MPEKYANYKKGDQVVCIPDHADGDIRHPNVEFGFVMEDKSDHCWVRYFYADTQKTGTPVLRTVANSESTPKWMLRKHYFALQSYIDTTIAKIEAEREENV